MWRIVIVGADCASAARCGTPTSDTQHSSNAAIQRPRMRVILWQITRAVGRRLVAEDEKRRRKKCDRGGGVRAALTEALKRAVPPHRSDGSPQTFERAGRALHGALLFLRSAVTHQRDD